jgi:hypothetical protein
MNGDACFMIQRHSDPGTHTHPMIRDPTARSSPRGCGFPPDSLS